MSGYVKFVIVILIIALVVYIIATVDFKNAVSFDFLKIFKFPSGPTQTSTETIEIGNRNAGVVIRRPETPFDEPAPVPPPGFTASQLSPFYQKVRIGGVNRGFGFNGISSIYLSVSDLREAVNVTGWLIRSNKGTILTIPKAIADYKPVSSPVESDIILNPGDYLNIYDTVTSFGFNLRLNKCTGYLNNNFDFDPELPRACPFVERSEIVSLSGKCQSFILSLGGCRQPTADELNSFSNESACISYLNTVNYGNCYNRYRSDADFFSREWRISMGRNFNAANLDSQHDRILLFDKRGLLVDEYIY